jgi:hypothetical protein
MTKFPSKVVLEGDNLRIIRAVMELYGEHCPGEPYNEIQAKLGMRDEVRHFLQRPDEYDEELDPIVAMYGEAYEALFGPK